MRKKKNDSTKKTFMLITAAIFILSTVAGVFLNQGGQENIITVNVSDRYYKFETGNYNNYLERYTLKLNGMDLKFSSLPSEAAGIDFPEDSLLLLKSTPQIDVTFDPEEDEIEFIEQVVFDLALAYEKQSKYLRRGITQNSTLYTLPRITCEDATSFVPVLYIKTRNETKVYNQNNCIHIEGRRLELLKVRDRILYNLYGVI